MSNYMPEFGRATGGVINIVTKGGTNSVHGNVFGFLRHKSIQARNPFSVHGYFPDNGFIKYVNSTLFWSDELTMLFLTWFTFIGIAIGFREKLHLSMDMIENFIPKIFITILDYSILICTFAFGVYMFYFRHQPDVSNGRFNPAYYQAFQRLAVCCGAVNGIDVLRLLFSSNI